MIRAASNITLVVGAYLLIAAAQAQENRHDWSVGLELDALSEEASRKLAAEPGSDFWRVVFVYSGRIKPTLTIDAVVDVVDDGPSGIDVTEAYLTWNPVPRSAFEFEMKAGAFYPPLSLENPEPDWGSPYTNSSSAINTWIGEELRTVGSEWSVSRALGPRARQQEIRFLAAVYYANDPAGALLSWRGWAIHSRQTRLGDAIDLPDLPLIAPGMMFQTQAPYTEPFYETDHRPGYYYGAEWRVGRRALLTALHYDNHADPASLKDGNYGWTTRFNHLGVQLELPAEFGLIMQWMDGTTVMGPHIPPATDGPRVVDNGFDAAFALLTKQHERHRWSLRFEEFAVADYDQIPLDDNSEQGDAITAAWRYQAAPNWSIGLEWISLDVERPSFAYFGEPVAQSEDLFRLQVRFQFAAATGR